MDRRTDPVFFRLLAGSHARLVGRPLVSSGMPDGAAAEWLYRDAPFGVLAHNTDPDPVFMYGNRRAQELFEYDWDELTALPSRLSAAAPERGERERFLERVARAGYVSDYSGERISKHGRRFRIVQATVWQLVDDGGVLRGQAALIPRIEAA